MESTKFKISCDLGIIEFEGSESFVEKHIKKVDEYLKTMSIAESSEKSRANATPKDGKQGSTPLKGSILVPEIFGEWLNKFPKEILDLDKALITAYFVQKQSGQNEFKTSDVNKFLTEHGIKLSNPSRDLKNLSTKKYMFQVRKDGKLSFKRVSVEGENYLKGLLQI
ncbi:hypothetical protein EFP84_18720 [Leptospira kmetyi]|uniref:Uncharacterized protein n=1 Tax=Leptospira kmetyi TaxID=408139 RepID=A0AAD0UTG6_9LEPT|nr:hypothetical protein [Leptospira kmetyi]AYV57679.1 hypothetical protein EFP84_18720 [Leptospira kmetyi]